MKNSKNFVLIHGAWYGAWVWDSVKKELEKKGHNIYTVKLPYYNENSTEPITLKTYVQEVKKCINDNNIENPILVGHSMAGIILSQFEADHPNVAEKLIYLAAFVIPDGETIKSFVLDKRLNDEKGAKKILKYYRKLPVYRLDKSSIQERFFQNHKIVNGTLLNLLHQFKLNMPFHPIGEDKLKIRKNFYKNNSKMFYILCTEDRAVPKEEAIIMLDKVEFKKNNIVKLQGADHSPCFSMPNKLGELLHEIGNKKIKGNRVPIFKHEKFLKANK